MCIAQILFILFLAAVYSTLRVARKGHPKKCRVAQQKITMASQALLICQHAIQKCAWQIRHMQAGSRVGGRTRLI